MASMKQDNNNYSSNYYAGEDASRQANILASCYLVDQSTASLKGLHYCTTGATGAECPPLAALTSTNELALTPKAKKSNLSSRSSINGRPGSAARQHQHRRGGATLRIREECERFFCEMLRAMFLGERNAAMQRSGLTGVYNDNHHVLNNLINNDNIAYYDINDVTDVSNRHQTAINANGQMTPPNDCPIGDKTLMESRGVNLAGKSGSMFSVCAWMEIWDYAGGSSFRAFVAEDALGNDKSLFVFFDAYSVSRDLKKALVALIELAEGPLECTQMVICMDRLIPDEEAKVLVKGLQWAGFSLTTLDFWSGGLDVVSDRWLFMGMEV